MANPIWLDSSAIINIAEGDFTLRSEVQRRAQGGPLLIAPKVKEEVTLGNPFKRGRWETQGEQAKACQAVINDLKIQVDTMGNEADRREFFEKQFKFKPKGPSPVVRAIEESDAIILSQISASAKARGITAPTFLTLDDRLRNAPDAKQWPVSITTRQTPRPVPSVGTPSGLPYTGTPGMDPSKANGVLLGIMVVGALLNWLSDIITEERIRKDVAELESWIRSQQQADPTMGILVVIELWQMVPPESGGYVPAPNYQGSTLVYGVNRTTAENNLRRQWSATPPMSKRVLRTIWIPPLRPATERPVVPGQKPAWFGRYSLVLNAMAPPPDYTEALHVLNGSSMYDIVNSLRMLRSDRNADFSMLWKRLDGDVPQFLRTRLSPAFSAVSDVVGGTGDLSFYKSRLGSAFTQLSQQDQAGIEEFFGGGTKASSATVLGRWHVGVGASAWYYHFGEKGALGYSELAAPTTIKWQGSWKMSEGALEVQWQKSKELWPLPLKVAGQTGSSYQEGGKVLAVTARKA